MAATHSLSLTAASSQYATISDGASPNIDITGSQTWETWVSLAALSTQYYIAGIRASGGGNLKGFWCDTANNFYFSLSGLTTNESATKQLVNTANTWFHVAGVYNGSTIKLYVNGEEVDSRTASGTTAAITAGFSIGRFGDQAASYMGGKVRNFRIWNVARTQDQIRTDMNVDTPSVTTGLQGNWILNNAYTDSSGNGYTLTASGSPTFSTTYPDALDLVENSNWTANNRLVLNVSSLSLSGDLTDVPVPLTESIFSTTTKDAVFAAAKSDGSDVRFSTDIDGKIRLAHELVAWDNTGKTMEIHLKINSLDVDADNTIYMHYGNSGASALNENEAFGKHQVWGENWEGVWHMQEASGTRYDSSKNSNDLTDNNTVTAQTGKIGLNSAQFTRANSESLTISDNASLSMGNEDFMIMSWMYFDSKSNFMDMVSKWNDTGNQRGYTVNYSSGSDRLRFYVSSNGSDFPAVIANNYGSLTTGQWLFVIAWHDSTANTINISVNNGTADSASHSAGVYDNTAVFTLGNQAGASLYHDGRLDDTRIYRGLLSADFRKALYNLQNDPAGFIEVVESSNGNFFMFL